MRFSNPETIKKEVESLLTKGKTLCEGLVSSTQKVIDNVSNETIGSSGSVGRNAINYRSGIRTLHDTYTEALTALKSGDNKTLLASIKEIERRRSRGDFASVVGEAASYQQTVNGIESFAKKPVAQCNPGMNKINEALKAMATGATALRANMLSLGQMEHDMSEMARDGIRGQSLPKQGGFHATGGGGDIRLVDQFK